MSKKNDFSDFRDFFNLWKKKIIYNEIFFLVQNLKWATAHLSRRLGAGLGFWACRRWAGAGARWAEALGARRQARQACVGAGRGAQAGVRGRWAWRAGRRAWARGQAAEARERSGAHASWACAAGGRSRAGRERQARRGRAGRWAWARGARGLGAWAGLGQCTRCTRPIFDPF